ncbi:unnamed protein product [Larinioides sclopetarius]|uniref:Proton-coupled folate transporter n=1 Tax=Larinioides sclopetarius TaxID=280406 RepID=A0AAV2AM50_9ARAC
MPSSCSEEVVNSGCSYPENSEDISASVHCQNTDSHNSYNEQTAKEIKSNTGCIKRIFDSLRIEVFAFLILFSITLIQITSTSLILDKVCLVNYNYSLKTCSNLDNYTEIKSAVEKTATNYQLGYSLILSAPSALLSCFIGPWSDLYGRKIPMLIAVFGVTAGTLGSAICAYFMYSRVEYFYIPTLFTSCFGGYITILAIIYSYASDLTMERQRTMKYAFLEMAAGLGQPLGTAVGGWILKILGYPSVFLLSASGFTISFIWVCLCLPETRGQGNKDASKFKKLFTRKAFKESFDATAKKRPNKGRKQILLLIISMCIAITSIFCSGNINYLFVHHQYNWGETKYSNISAIYSLISVIVLAAVVPACKFFKLGDPILGLIGTTSLILKNICFGLAWNPILFHFGNFLGCFAGCALLAVRSRISKVVSNDDLGKVFSFMASAETLFPVLMMVVISEIFTSFLDIYTAMPYIVLAICLLLPFSVFIWLLRLSVKDSIYSYFENEKTDA